jgi:hypothetical protein
MNQISEIDDDLRPEYDFTQLTVVAFLDHQWHMKSNVVGRPKMKIIMSSKQRDIIWSITLGTGQSI